MWLVHLFLTFLFYLKQKTAVTPKFEIIFTFILYVSSILYSHHQEGKMVSMFGITISRTNTQWLLEFHFILPSLNFERKICDAGKSILTFHLNLS